MVMDYFRIEIREKIDDIRKKVTIQNGRVGKLEKWQAFTQGAVTVLLVLVVPIFLQVVHGFVNQVFGG